MILKWKSLRALAQTQFIAPNGAFLICVPIIANFVMSLEVSSLWNAILQVVEADNIELPKNMTRLYFASLFVLVAQVVTQIHAGILTPPSSSLDEWRIEADGSQAELEAQKESKTGTNESERLLKKRHSAALKEFDEGYRWLRLFCCGLLVAAALLAFWVVGVNMLSVLKVSQIF